MTDDRSVRGLGRTDVELEAALRDLGRTIAWPTAQATAGGLDLAGRTRLRLVADGSRRERRRIVGSWWMPGRTPARRALGLALLLIVVAAAVAAAIGLGGPGIRLVPAPATVAPSTGAGSASPSPSPSSIASPAPTIPGPPGSALGLGVPVAAGSAAGAVDFALRLPPEATTGAAASAWLLDGRLSLVWTPRPGLPATTDRDVGLILTQFRGDVDPGYFEKILTPGTTITPVAVGDASGYWISGQPHEIVYVNPSGEPVFDSRRIVGDSLIWARDGITYRLETGLDQAAAVALAESLR